MFTSLRLIPVVLLTASWPAQAQVSVRVPGVTVEVGPGVVVQTPFLTVLVPPKAPALGFGLPYVPPPSSVSPSVPPTTPPVPPVAPDSPTDPNVPPVPPQEEQLLPAPPTPPQPLPQAKGGPGVLPSPLPNPFPKPQPGPLVVGPPTPQEFAAGAKNLQPGRYELILLHPYTKQPVLVCFDLPVCPKRINASKDTLNFRWGLFKGVSIFFERDGSVRIKKC
ncbi:MAG: hypothetical protein SNJ82_04835 [Gemmataceae bacterium]